MDGASLTMVLNYMFVTLTCVINLAELHKFIQSMNCPDITYRAGARPHDKTLSRYAIALEFHAMQETTIGDACRGQKNILRFTYVCLGQNLTGALPQHGLHA